MTSFRSILKISSAPEVRQIVESSIATTHGHWPARLHYTYTERKESWRGDPAERVKLQDTDVSRTILVNGVRFEQLVERNGQPPSVEEKRRQKEEFDELKRKTPEQRVERRRQQEEENTYSSDAAPRLSSAGQARQDVLQVRGHVLGRQAGPCVDQGPGAGRPAVLDGTIPGAPAAGLRNQDGADARRRRGWTRERVEVRAAAKVFLVKSLVDPSSPDFLGILASASGYAISDPVIG